MTTPSSTSTTPDVDVLIVGAGISGIGAAYHLQDKSPGRTYAILEARAALGGTWDLFRYPGIRSDSDLQTFGYAFKPWTDEKAIADGPAIRQYIHETATENGIEPHIQFNSKVLSADWSTETAAWTVSVQDAQTGERREMRSRWLFCAGGYYSYDGGFTPEFTGIESFAGQVIHPQHWPEDLDYAGKRVVVIGSGATAVTLVPAMAPQAGHVTMLQRSPSYILPVPARDPLADKLRAWFGDERGYWLARRKNILRQAAVYRGAKRFPKAVRAIIRAINRKALPEGYAVDTHFKPTYDPWDQRLCAVPDGDLYKALHTGKASVVTDTIARFDATGIQLTSGERLDADIVVTATGLNLLAFGGIELSLDGTSVDLPGTVAYKSMMLSGVPNFAYAIGYTNASWTLKVDLVCEHFCRLLNHCAEIGMAGFVPEIGGAQLELRPLLDFQAGYVLRALDRFPKQGTVDPWSMAQNFFKDEKRLRKGPITDAHLRFIPQPRPAERPAEELIAA